jgi:hypothetical protein
MRNLNEVAYHLGPRPDTAFLRAVEQAAAMWFISDPSLSLAHGKFDANSALTTDWFKFKFSAWFL